MSKYQKPVYSKETLDRWAEAGRKSKEFAKKHSSEVIKDYKVEGYTIRCIQRKYDTCMKKENEYGVQVWMCNPDTVTVEDIFDCCVSNEWFNNPDDANKRFKQVKAMCY